MTDPDAPDRERPRLGLLDPLVQAERAAGREVRLTLDERELRGDPPHGRLLGAGGRGEVEAAWDVGPLLAWYAEPRGWCLQDRRTRAWIDLGAPRDDEPRAPAAGRRRIGWLADEGPLDWGGFDPSLERERERLRGGPPSAADGGRTVLHVGARRVVTEEPAELVLQRFREVVEASGTRAPLPAWVQERCAPGWHTSEGRERRARLDELRGRAARQAGWWLRWTPAEVARHLDPAERAWRFQAGRVVADDAFDLEWFQARPAGTVDVARFLLAAAGAVECGRSAPRRT